MSLFTKMGEAAAAATDNTGGAQESPITSFKSGSSFKVGVKSVYDVAEYYGYSIYKKVNTFVPKNPAKRNNRGFVESDPTLWDRAADLLYADAKAAKDAGASEEAVKKITDEAYLYRGKQRFLRAFYDLSTGKDIVVDLSPKQEKTLKAVIEKYSKKLGTIAFELTKTGASTNAVVALSPIIDMDEDLTEEERKNFAKLGEKPFDMALFETCLYVADEDEQTKNLVVAGFDISRLGLTIGAAAPAQSGGSDADKPLDISDEDLPF
ncbi:hypothetical protein DFP94_101491 [Fontibacillus phaseoli]|uniref:Uncharacterized protein n=1 Tax=Fontibacillus phaseoli TaxID=1416533 RepID=A0A369BMS9_9BACL|nr:hypothetical protein [Fontibacillus phaseoli]RCX22902.1 hypothetical protein DFP94_101491 [Fontibacillus phaseoli]